MILLLISPLSLPSAVGSDGGGDARTLQVSVGKFSDVARIHWQFADEKVCVQANARTKSVDDGAARRTKSNEPASWRTTRSFTLRLTPLRESGLFNGPCFIVSSPRSRGPGSSLFLASARGRGLQIHHQNAPIRDSLVTMPHSQRTTMYGRVATDKLNHGSSGEFLW